MSWPFGPIDPKINLIEGLPLLTLDAETTFQVENGKLNPTPHDPQNELVSVGYRYTLHTAKSVSHIDNYLCFFHNEEPSTPNAVSELQEVLDDTAILIGHNVKFDMEYLIVSGFNIHETKISVWDTMLVEYIFLRALPGKISLAEVLKRRGLTPKYTGMDEYLQKKISVEDIPWEIVLNRGRQDVSSTYELFLAQLKDLEIDDVYELLNAYNLKHFHQMAFKLFGKKNNERLVTDDNINKSNVSCIM